MRHPSSLQNHLHRDLLLYIDRLLRNRDHQGLSTNLFKVKAHIGVTFNEEADAAANAVVLRKMTPTLTFDIGAHTPTSPFPWPHRRSGDSDFPLPNLKEALRRSINRTLVLSSTVRPTKHGTLWDRAISAGLDCHLLKTNSRLDPKPKTTILEFAWGVYNSRLDRNHPRHLAA